MILRRSEKFQARGFENYIGCVAWNYRDQGAGAIPLPLALKRDFGAHEDQARVASWQRLLASKDQRFRLSDLQRPGRKPSLPPLSPERKLAPEAKELEEKGWNTVR